jgi:uncharacterized protein (TIGR00369 family)
MSTEVPADFEELPEGLGFTDILAPVYRRSGDIPAIGMLVQSRHVNLIGICHGGVLMTLADVGASWAINYSRGKVAAAPTLNLSFDFIAAAREGDWLQAEADRVTVKKRVGFSSGVITSRDTVICRFSGSFYLPDHDGFAGNLERIARLHGQG